MFKSKELVLRIHIRWVVIFIIVQIIICILAGAGIAHYEKSRSNDGGRKIIPKRPKLVQVQSVFDKRTPRVLSKSFRSSIIKRS